MSRNLAASIRARLKQRADVTKQDFNLTLTHYGWSGSYTGCRSRRMPPTTCSRAHWGFRCGTTNHIGRRGNADLLGFGPDDLDTAVAAFREICQVEVEDGIAFDPASVKGSVIRKEAGYGGVRIDLRAKLDGARIALQVDIGFGDAVTPAPETVSYPVLLEDLPAPQLRSSPKYTVVAEKFHAVCLLGMANTRMKDYFDLWVLLAEVKTSRVCLLRRHSSTVPHLSADGRSAAPHTIGA